MLKSAYRNLVALTKFILFSLAVLATFIVSPFTYFISKSLHKKLLKAFCLMACFILNIRVLGDSTKKLKEKGKLFVSNHCSYLDIIVIGRKIPVRFTPKSDIKKWPALGLLTNISLPVYIERKGSKALEQKKIINSVIESGDNIIIFPEGTTNNGQIVKPFKTSLFSVVEGNDTIIQPIAISYVEIDGKPSSERNIDMVAWYGDMEFLPHFWNLLKSTGVKAEINYLEPVSSKNFDDRKALAKYCEGVISASVKNIKTLK